MNHPGSDADFMTVNTLRAQLGDAEPGIISAALTALCIIRVGCGLFISTEQPMFSLGVFFYNK